MIETPIETPDEGGHGTILSHPAFGQISVSRVSGLANLYGSDFQHHSYVVIRISHSTMRRNLSNDWPHARGEIIEIALSEAQWATFVSSFGVGSGVQCTLQWMKEHGAMPRLPVPASRADQFGREMKEDFDEAVKALDDALIDAQSLGLSKPKLALITDRIIKAKRALQSSAPFVAEQFGEHMETSFEKAKVELHGYATGMFAALGIQAIAGGKFEGMISAEIPISLPDHHEGESE